MVSLWPLSTSTPHLSTCTTSPIANAPRDPCWHTLDCLHHSPVDWWPLLLTYYSICCGVRPGPLMTTEFRRRVGLLRDTMVHIDSTVTGITGSALQCSGPNESTDRMAKTLSTIRVRHPIGNPRPLAALPSHHSCFQGSAVACIALATDYDLGPCQLRWKCASPNSSRLDMLVQVYVLAVLTKKRACDPYGIRSGRPSAGKLTTPLPGHSLPPLTIVWQSSLIVPETSLLSVSQASSRGVVRPPSPPAVALS